MKKLLRSIGIGFICLMFASTADAAIRIVAYNFDNYPNNTTQEDHFRTIFEAIGNQSVNGIAKRLDILVVVEMDPTSADTLTTILNNLYGVNSYTNELSSHYGGDRTGFIYDNSTVTMIGNAVNLTNIGTRPVLRAQFRPFGSTTANEQFYIYAIHLQSGSGNAAITQRTTEAANLRNDADALAQGSQIIYAGDLNLTTSSEGAWTNLLAAGNG